MAGLASLIFGAVLGGSAIRCGIDNAKMMSKPYRYLDDGTPVYLDRLSNEHINGEKVISKAVTNPDGSVKLQQVGQRSGRVYFDPDDALAKRRNAVNQDKIRLAKKMGKLSYAKYDPQAKRELTCEISTGKYISYLEGCDDGTYWKYYLPANYTYYSDRDKNAGIQIKQDEYDALNIFDGSHFACDLNRYTYDTKLRTVLRNKPLVAREDLPKVPGRE